MSAPAEDDLHAAALDKFVSRQCHNEIRKDVVCGGAKAPSPLDRTVLLCPSCDGVLPPWTP